MLFECMCSCASVFLGLYKGTTDAAVALQFPEWHAEHCSVLNNEAVSEWIRCSGNEKGGGKRHVRRRSHSCTCKSPVRELVAVAV